MRPCETLSYINHPFATLEGTSIFRGALELIEVARFRPGDEHPFSPLSVFQRDFPSYPVYVPDDIDSSRGIRGDCSFAPLRPR